MGGGGTLSGVEFPGFECPDGETAGIGFNSERTGLDQGHPRVTGGLEAFERVGRAASAHGVVGVEQEDGVGLNHVQERVDEGFALVGDAGDGDIGAQILSETLEQGALTPRAEGAAVKNSHAFEIADQHARSVVETPETLRTGWVQERPTERLGSGGNPLDAAGIPGACLGNPAGLKSGLGWFRGGDRERAESVLDEGSAAEELNMSLSDEPVRKPVDSMGVEEGECDTTGGRFIAAIDETVVIGAWKVHPHSTAAS